MVLAEKTGKVLRFACCFAVTSSFFIPSPSPAQGPPEPGYGSVSAPSSAQYTPSQNPALRSAPAPNMGAMMAAPVPGAPTAAGLPANFSAGPTGGYGRLPLNPGNAVARLEELRNYMPTARPKEFQEAIAEYCDWLSDMADAHWRLSQSFAKADATKAQSESEKQLCLKFGGLKRQAMLLKAEFLISQRRYPEALAPLVDIVTAEPRTETGQHAYKLLQEIGFSEQAQVPVAKSATPQ